MNFFDELEIVLLSNDKDSKLFLFREFYKRFLDGKFKIEKNFKEANIFDKPSYSSFCRVVDPKEVLNRKSPFNREGKAILTHSIAHIEYSAIDLALDASYRYKDMPYEFYSDWLEVADDEVRHFLMLEGILESLGYKYGDFPVHSGLFEASLHSLEFIDRMALIPRYMEANGLDANPLLINRLSSQDKLYNRDLIDALKVILDEEIGHVKKGDKWFKYGCDKLGISYDSYFSIVEKIYPNSFNKKQKSLNKKARLQAGFTIDELDRIESSSKL